MAKRATISSAKRKTWAVFSLYVRTRDCLETTGSPEWGECISCNETKHISELDAGHYIPKHNANYFSERGVNAQCRHCNAYLHGNPLGYRRGLIEKYGEDVADELEYENRPIKKFTIQELKELEYHYQEKIKKLEGV